MVDKQIQEIRYKVILPMVITLVLSLIFMYVFLLYSNEKTIVESSVKYAKNNISQYLILRKYYTQKVIGLVQEKSNLEVDILAQDKPGTIPLPSTMIHELNELFQKENTQLTIKLYSDFPFSNRKNRKIDNFEKESLKFLRNNPTQTISKREMYKNKDSVRVVVPDIFSHKNCVTCHNNLASSPKRDWKLNDVAGALEIIVPVDVAIDTNNRITLFEAGVFFLIFVLMMGWVIKFIFHLNKMNKNIRGMVHKLDYHKAALDSHAIVSVTDIKGNITYVNDKFCEISKYTKEELIGKNHRMIKSNEHDSSFFEVLWKTISNGDIWQGEIKNIDKNGEYYWVLTTILPIFDENDKNFQYISIRTDITAIKDIEEELEEAKIDAVNASNIKSQFLANMSHEIRTPLNAILGFSDILYNLELDKKNKEYALIISNSANVLMNIINDILDISKIESGNLIINNEPIKIHSFIDQIVELFSIGAKEKNIRFVYYIEPKVPFIVFSDATKLRQVISNLLSNAIKFTPKNGRIDFYIKLMELNDASAKINFIIKDSGIGISNNQKELIFKPFQQADETISKKFGGTGLGLAISNDIIKLMGSRIYISSNIGKGSEFLFTLDLDIEKIKNEDKKESTNLSFILCNCENGEYLDISLHYYLKEFGKVYNIKDNYYEYADILFCFNVEDFEKITKFKEINVNLIVVYVGDENRLNFKDILIIDYFIDLPIYRTKISNLISDAFSINKPITSSSNELKKFDINVLLAEDNINNQKLLCVLLSKIGVTCTIAEDGVEAIKLYKSKRFDLILMDINMPHLDGISATQKILKIQKDKNFHKTPIIALTAHSINGDKEKYIKHGMDDYISKPIKFDELYKIIEKYSPQNKNEISNKNKEDEIKKVEVLKNGIKNEKDLIQIHKYKKSDAVEQLGLDESTVDMLLVDFFLTLDEDIKKIKIAIDSKNSKDIESAAHYLKSSCVNFAMNDATKILKDIEERAKNGETENFDIINLKQIFDDIKKLV